MSKFNSERKMIMLAGAAALFLSACTSHYHGSRYGGDPCQVNCMPMPAYQPVYYTPPQPQPKPLPTPTRTVLRPTPAPTPTPEPTSCPAGWMMGTRGVCLEIVAPTYVPPSTTGYPDIPKKKRKVYKVGRK